MKARREYGSFPKALAREVRSATDPLALARVSDIVYAQEAPGFWKVVNFQLSRTGGIDFYVNYGIAIPSLGVPWFPLERLRDAGLLVSERLYHERGQGYRCESLADLRDSVAKVAVGLAGTVVPWFALFETLAQVTHEYGRRWGLKEHGSNATLKRQGVLNYGLLQLACGCDASAEGWLREALLLMQDPIDQEDRQRIQAVLAARFGA